MEVPNDEDDNKEPTKVCYEELGCFEEAGYIDLLPNSPEEVNTRYLLYNSRRSRGDTPLLDVSAQNVSSLWEWVGKAFNVSAPTKVIVHGFGSSCSNVWVYEMRSALMSVVSLAIPLPSDDKLHTYVVARISYDLAPSLL